MAQGSWPMRSTHGLGPSTDMHDCRHEASASRTDSHAAILEETAMSKSTTSHIPAPQPLKSEELHLIDAWWRACNYLSVGMIYLKDNALLKEPLQAEHVKHRLLGHWGASPALSF